jgi:hypothetical protein
MHIRELESALRFNQENKRALALAASWPALFVFFYVHFFSPEFSYSALRSAE